MGQMQIESRDGRDPAVLYAKTSDGRLRRERVLPVRFVPMTGEAQQAW